MSSAPFVTVIVPCRDEAPHIRRCLNSIAATEHPRDRLEVLVVDGMSTDGTREILERASQELAFLRVLDNEKMIVPAAMNLGIAGGRVVNVPNGPLPWARAVAAVTGHTIGVGNSAYKTRARFGFIDTVPCGTFRRAVLEEVGLFDERLTRNQDNELAARLIKRGYKIAYDPDIRITYRNQATLGGLVRQAYFSGMWNVYALCLAPYTWKLRRFVPAAFVLYLAVLAFCAARTRGCALAALPLAAYGAAVACYSVSARSRGGGAPRVAATLVSYHLSYGLGAYAGAANLLTGRWRGHLGRPLKI